MKSEGQERLGLCPGHVSTREYMQWTFAEQLSEAASRSWQAPLWMPSSLWMGLLQAESRPSYKKQQTAPGETSLLLKPDSQLTSCL